MNKTLSITKHFDLSKSEQIVLEFTSNVSFKILRYAQCDTDGFWKDIDLKRLEILDPEEYLEIMKDLERFLEKQDRLPFQESNKTLTTWGV